MAAALAELKNGLAGMLGAAPPASSAVADGSIVLGTPDSSPQVAARAGTLRLAAAGPEGFVLQSTRWDGHAVTLIAANSDVGLLYGAFRYLALMQRHEALTQLDVHEAPRLKLRVLDHWIIRTAPSNAAMPASPSGISGACPGTWIRATGTMRGLMPPSASTVPY
jgi:alpha-glucuronidase